MLTFNSHNDHERGLVVFKAMMQDRAEEQAQATFNGVADIVSDTDHPLALSRSLSCGGAGDFLLYRGSIVAKSIDFWINLGSTTETIIDPVSGNDIAVSGGTLQYTDWDDAFVDGVNTDTITTGWHHVCITSTTDVDWASGINVGKGDFEIAGLRFWNCELSLAEIGQLYNGTVSSYRKDCVLLLNFPNLSDLSRNGNDGTNYGADIVTSGRNGGNCFEFIKANFDYINCGSGSSLSFGSGGTDSPLSIELWVELTAFAQYDTIIGKYSVLGSFREYRLWKGGVNGLDFEMYNPDAAGNKIGRRCSQNLPLNQWMHLAVIYDGSKSASGISIYIDLARSDDTGTSAGAYTGMEDTASDFDVAAYQSGVRNLDALIDLVGVYNTNLSFLQINERYQTGLRGLL